MNVKARYDVGPIVRIRLGAKPTYLERLALAFAEPMRLKIITELYQQEMSPSAFFATFGGGSLSRVDRHFKKLAEHEWLRQVRSETGGRRRGGTEHFYRAPKPAVFDNETWAQLPRSVREEFSWRIFEQFAEQANIAFEAGTFDSRVDRHLTWTPMALDEEGRERVLAAVDRHFHHLSEEREDAGRRLALSGEQPIRAIVALAAFDSPPSPRVRSGLTLPVTEAPTFSGLPFVSRLARVFSDGLNLRIVSELNRREMSPSQFEREFGIPMSQVYPRFRMLLQEGWLEKAGERTGGRRRGSTEHFYRATGPTIYDTRSWSRASAAVRSSESWRIFEQLAEQVKQALDSGTFDRRTDRHHTWTPMLLDERGWRQVIAGVDALFYSLLAEQKAAARRIERSGEAPQPATAYIAAFELPPRRADEAEPLF